MKKLDLNKLQFLCLNYFRWKKQRVNNEKLDKQHKQILRTETIIKTATRRANYALSTHTPKLQNITVTSFCSNSAVILKKAIGQGHQDWHENVNISMEAIIMQLQVSKISLKLSWEKVNIRFLPSLETHQVFPLHKCITNPQKWFVHYIVHTCNNHTESELNRIKTCQANTTFGLTFLAPLWPWYYVKVTNKGTKA